MHHHNGPLNQLADPSRRKSLIHGLERSAAWPVSAARRFPLSPWSSLLPRPQLSLSAGPARVAVVAQGHQPAILPSPRSSRFHQVKLVPLASPTQAPLSPAAVAAMGAPSRAPIPSPKRAPRCVSSAAPLRCQALVLSALPVQEIKRLLHQPRRMSFLPLAMVERLVTGVVAQHARDRSGRSAPRWSAPYARTTNCFSFCFPNLTLDFPVPPSQKG